MMKVNAIFTGRTVGTMNRWSRQPPLEVSVELMAS